MKCRWILAFALAVTVLNLEAQILPTSPTTLWTPITYPNNNNPDPFADQQTGGRESDIVGSLALPSFYKQFYDGGTAGILTDGQFGLRLRLAQLENPPGYTGAAFVGLDGDGDGSLDIFVGVNNQGSGNQVGIWDAGNGLNISPNTTTITSPARFSYTETAANYDWSAVSLTLNPGAPTLDVDGSGGTDYFLTWVVPFADLVAAMLANGVSGFNQNSALGLVAATATQDNSLNQDLNGVAGSVNSTFTWEQIGAASLAYSASGTDPVPEPSTTLLILVAMDILGRRRLR
jgi:hypothetical protein